MGVQKKTWARREGEEKATRVVGGEAQKFGLEIDGEYYVEAEVCGVSVYQCPLRGAWVAY